MLMALYVVLQFTHAWIVDDAYITLRTVDNFVHGLGLRWNPSERVQSYTHPLWMFLLSAAYLVTREAYYTTLAVAFSVSLLAIAAVLRAPRVRREPFRAIIFLSLLLGSKAFSDYSSSGLENPLTHLCLGLFYTRFLVDEEDERGFVLLLLTASLCFVNRMDTVLLFAPACAYAIVRRLRAKQPLLSGLGWGGLPALAWCAFAFFYYGSIVPNTALAKLAGPRVTFAERVSAGLAYFADSAMNDPLSLLTCFAALALALSTRVRRLQVAALGVLLYLVYVLTTGAIGTHMSGRFFSVTVFLSALLLAHIASEPRVALVTSALVAVWFAASPVSPLRVGFDTYGRPRLDRPNQFVIDTRMYVLDEGAALLNLVPGESMPRHPWYRAGLEYRDNPEKVHQGGLVVNLAIGYSAFASGPSKHFIDMLGLSDPLIARIPMRKGQPFRPGHFWRDVPAGYVESLEHNQNRIVDPDLRAYYEAIRIITRAPLWSGERIATLFKFSFGAYDVHLHAFAQRHGLRTR